MYNIIELIYIAPVTEHQSRLEDSAETLEFEFLKIFGEELDQIKSECCPDAML